MTTDSREILSALIDREPVDADRLAVVLEGPDARALLVDFVRLRATISMDDEDVVPAWEASGSTHGRLSGPWWHAAAAVLLLAGATTAGMLLAERSDQQEPPPPTR